MNYYAGIGSRGTPASVCLLMANIAKELAKEDFILRSGGAEGADLAFESGAGDLKEIWLPWLRFNQSTSTLLPSEASYTLASQHHPAWRNLSYGAKKMHSRNCHQVLGYDLNTPSKFVICWTEKGSGKGGTGQAIRIAKAHNVPIIDLGSKIYNNISLDELMELLRDYF